MALLWPKDVLGLTRFSERGGITLPPSFVNVCGPLEEVDPCGVGGIILKCVSDSNSCGVGFLAGETVRCTSGRSGPCGPGANCVFEFVCVLFCVCGMFVDELGLDKVFVFELPPMDFAREDSGALVVSDVRTGGSVLGSYGKVCVCTLPSEDTVVTAADILAFATSVN